jgi:hypothetical protein
VQRVQHVDGLPQRGDDADQSQASTDPPRRCARVEVPSRRNPRRPRFNDFTAEIAEGAEVWACCALPATPLDRTHAADSSERSAVRHDESSQPSNRSNRSTLGDNCSVSRSRSTSGTGVCGTLIVLRSTSRRMTAWRSPDGVAARTVACSQPGGWRTNRCRRRLRTVRLPLITGNSAAPASGSPRNERQSRWSRAGSRAKWS